MEEMQESRNYNEWGRYLRYYREAANLSQREVATALSSVLHEEFAPQRYNNYEIRNSQPNLKVLKALTHILHVSADDLLNHRLPSDIDNFADSLRRGAGIEVKQVGKHDRYEVYCHDEDGTYAALHGDHLRACTFLAKRDTDRMLKDSVNEIFKFNARLALWENIAHTNLFNIGISEQQANVSLSRHSALSNGFSNRLADLRKKQNWSQTEFAKRLGFNSVQTYNRYETREAQPDLDTLAKMSDLLQVSVNELIDGYNPNFQERAVDYLNSIECKFKYDKENDRFTLYNDKGNSFMLDSDELSTHLSKSLETVRSNLNNTLDGIIADNFRSAFIRQLRTMPLPDKVMLTYNDVKPYLHHQDFSLFREAFVMEKNKKFKFTGETKEIDGVTVHRIELLRDIKFDSGPNAGLEFRAGTKGGWIQNEDMLSHDGNCWVADEVVVCNKKDSNVEASLEAHELAEENHPDRYNHYSCVQHNALIRGESVVQNCIVEDDVRVGNTGDNVVIVDSCLFDNSTVLGHAKVSDSSLEGNALVRDSAEVWMSELHGNSCVLDNSSVDGCSMYDNAKVCDDASFIVYNNGLDQWPSYYCLSGDVEIGGSTIFCLNVPEDTENEDVFELSGNVKIMSGEYGYEDKDMVNAMSAENQIKDKKFEITEQSVSMEIDDINHTLYRIRALKDIPEQGVKKGDIGGCVEHEENLSHKGNCWIHKYAAVAEQGQVTDNASVRDFASVTGHARIEGNARLEDNAVVCDNSLVSDNAVVKDSAIVGGTSQILENSVVEKEAVVENKIVRGKERVVSDSVQSDKYKGLVEFKTILEEKFNCAKLASKQEKRIHDARLEASRKRREKAEKVKDKIKQHG